MSKTLKIMSCAALGAALALPQGSAQGQNAVLPPPASQFAQSRYGDRFLYKPVSDFVESGLERNSRSQVSQQRAGAVQQDRGAAAGEAAKRDLAFRLACHRRAQKSRALQES